MIKQAESLPKELGKCAGQWVAINSEHVVACGRTIKELHNRTDKLAVKNLRVFFVPDIKDGLMYF